LKWHFKPIKFFPGINEILPETEEKGEDRNKTLDVFVSYRRSNGSQLARY